MFPLRYDVIGISISGIDQLVPAFTLAKVSKEQYRWKKVVIGGALLPYMYNVLKTYRMPSNVDCFIFGEGETPLIKWLDYLKGNIGIQDVPSACLKC
ncbi:MAG: hypothetical protein ACLKAK_10185 [Alkaliphilus sp.]